MKGIRHDNSLHLSAQGSGDNTYVLCPFSAAWGSDRYNPIEKIEHLIVIYQENWHFDGLFGKFPGANGLARAGTAVHQVDKSGKSLDKLPQPLDIRKNLLNRI
jgi:phospholipase C